MPRGWKAQASPLHGVLPQSTGHNEVIPAWSRGRSLLYHPASARTTMGQHYGVTADRCVRSPAPGRFAQGCPASFPASGITEAGVSAWLSSPDATIWHRCPEGSAGTAARALRLIRTRRSTLVGILMTQRSLDPTVIDLSTDFWTSVYQAIDD